MDIMLLKEQGETIKLNKVIKILLNHTYSKQMLAELICYILFIAGRVIKSLQSTMSWITKVNQELHWG